MMPDEILRMDNLNCLVLLRGQKPMLLYKIIPDEFAFFSQLHFTPVGEHIPDWRTAMPQPVPIVNQPPATPVEPDEDVGMVEATIDMVRG